MGWLFAASVSAAVPSEDQIGRTSEQTALQPGPEATDDEAANSLGYEKLAFPIDRTLEDGEVQLQADSARVVIRWDADSDLPHVLARWSLAGTSGDLLFSSRSHTSSLRYIADPAIEGYPLIELHLTPNQSVTVVGSFLSVDAAGAPYRPQPNQDDETTQPPSSNLEIEATSSDLTVIDIPSLRINGDDSVVFASGGNGPWIFDLRSGSSEIVDHSGSVQFAGHHTETRFKGVLGTQSLDITESKAFIRGGGGSVEATTSGGSIEFDDTTGNLNIKAASTSVAVRRVRAGRLNLSGDNLYVMMEDGQGQARVTLDGGSFSAARWAQRIDLTARLGATATVRELDGDIAFDAADGASVRISGVTGHVRGKSFGSTIDASSLKSIQLQATDSDITVDQTRNLTTFVLKDSTARLNLYELLGTPEISLSGTSRADIELHYPCQVRVEGPGAKNAARFSVIGCENLRPDQGWAPPQRQRRGETPVEPIHLTLKMDQRSEVSVRGY